MNRRRFFKSLAVAALGAAAAVYTPRLRAAQPEPLMVDKFEWGVSDKDMILKMQREMAEAMFYGSPLSSAGFTGLTPRYPK
jgi:hypothetical protein